MLLKSELSENVKQRCGYLNQMFSGGALFLVATEAELKWLLMELTGALLQSDEWFPFLLNNHTTWPRRSFARSLPSNPCILAREIHPRSCCHGMQHNGSSMWLQKVAAWVCLSFLESQEHAKSEALMCGLALFGAQKTHLYNNQTTPSFSLTCWSEQQSQLVWMTSVKKQRILGRS